MKVSERGSEVGQLLIRNAKNLSIDCTKSFSQDAITGFLLITELCKNAHNKCTAVTESEKETETELKQCCVGQQTLNSKNFDFFRDLRDDAEEVEWKARRCSSSLPKPAGSARHPLNDHSSSTTADSSFSSTRFIFSRFT